MDKIGIWSSFISFLYIVYGAIQVYNGVIDWWFPWAGLSTLQLGIRLAGAYIPNSFPEPFSGIFLIVVGTVFLKAVYLQSKGLKEYRGYLLAGWILAMIMLAVNATVIVADILDTYYPLLWGEEIEEFWSLASDPWGLAPHLIVGILASPLYFAVRDLVQELMPGGRDSLRVRAGRECQ